MKKLFLIPFLLTFFLLASNGNAGQVPVFSKTSFEKNKIISDGSSIDQKSLAYPKGKKKRGISSSIEFVADTSYTPHTFNVAQVFYKPQQQHINILFSGNGKRGPPVLV